MRELIGYYRYDTEAELVKLNQIWELDALFTNYFLPQQKLIFKQRVGAKVIKKHDIATTPHKRTVMHPATRKRPIIAMNAAFKRIKPAALSRKILALTGQLEILSQAKKAPRAKPPVNTAWNNPNKQRFLHEATGRGNLTSSIHISLGSASASDLDPTHQPLGRLRPRAPYRVNSRAALLM